MGLLSLPSWRVVKARAPTVAFLECFISAGSFVPSGAYSGVDGRKLRSLSRTTLALRENLFRLLLERTLALGQQIGILAPLQRCKADVAALLTTRIER
jgi:hypothetical protein